MPSVLPSVTVITVSRRPALLSRVVQSIADQTYEGAIHHLIVIDGEVAPRLSDVSTPRIRTTVQLCPRTKSDTDGPRRLGRLRNMAVGMVSDPYIAFLDDDNAWLPDHLESLWTTSCEREGSIAYSWRRLLYADGSPYLKNEFPWARDPALRSRIYESLVVAGVFEHGSNIVRDGPDTEFTWIDLGEWLLPTDLITEIGFAEEFDEWDWFNITVEDRQFSEACLARGVPLIPTQRATLLYHLGGYSNTFEGDAIIWRRPANKVQEQ